MTSHHLAGVRRSPFPVALVALVMFTSGCFAARVDARVMPGLRLTMRGGLVGVPPRRQTQSDGRVTGDEWRTPFSQTREQRLMAADSSIAGEHGWNFANGYGMAFGLHIPLPTSAGLYATRGDAALFVALGLMPTAYIQFPRAGRFTWGLGLDVSFVAPAAQLPVTYSLSRRVHLTLTERFALGILSQLTTLTSQLALVVDVGSHASLFVAIAHHWSPFGFHWPQQLEIDGDATGDDVREHTLSAAIGITLDVTPMPHLVTEPR